MCARWVMQMCDLVSRLGRVHVLVERIDRKKKMHGVHLLNDLARMYCMKNFPCCFLVMSQLGLRGRDAKAFLYRKWSPYHRGALHDLIPHCRYNKIVLLQREVLHQMLWISVCGFFFFFKMGFWSFEEFPGVLHMKITIVFVSLSCSYIAKLTQR